MNSGIDVNSTPTEQLEVVIEQTGYEGVEVGLDVNPVLLELSESPEIQISVNENLVTNSSTEGTPPDNITLEISNGKLTVKNSGISDAKIGTRSLNSATASDNETTTPTLLTPLLQSFSNRIKGLLNRFNPTTGHSHNGADSPKVDYTNLNNKPILPPYPSTPSNVAFLRDDNTFQQIAVGSGGSAAWVYPTTITSTTNGSYKALSNTAETSETILLVVGNNNTTLIGQWLFDLPISTTVIPSGVWNVAATRSVSNAAGNSYIRAELFLYHLDGSTTTFYTGNGATIEDITLTSSPAYESVLPQVTCLTTDKVGLRLYFVTDRNANTTLQLVIGDGRAFRFSTPLAMRHRDLRDIDGDSSFVHLTQNQKNDLMYKSEYSNVFVSITDGFDTSAKIITESKSTKNTVLPTLLDVANKAQLSPNESGTILYHTLQWFTPTNTISTNTNTVTSVASQFTSAMVGAKLIINTEERIITSYISGNQVTVDSSYSINYNNIAASNWSVHAIALLVKSTSPTVNIYNQFGSSLLNEYGAKMVETNGGELRVDTQGVRVSSNSKIGFSSIPASTGTQDVAIRRNSVGVVEVSDSVTLAAYRDLNIRSLNYTGALNNTSDIRLKQNVTELHNASDKIVKLAKACKHFEYINQEDYAKGTVTDLIAQYVEEAGFAGHIKHVLPKDEEEGNLLGWVYKNEEYISYNSETGENELNTRRVVDIEGDKVKIVEKRFDAYIIKALAEQIELNKMLQSRIEELEIKINNIAQV